MRPLSLVLAALLATPAAAQQQEIQRALIQRDQQSAEFAAQVRSGYAAQAELEALHARQLGEAMVPLSANPSVAATLLPYQRGSMAQERELRFAPPVVRAPLGPQQVERALPLPGGPRPGVDPVTPEGVSR